MTTVEPFPMFRPRRPHGGLVVRVRMAAASRCRQARAGLRNARRARRGEPHSWTVNDPGETVVKLGEDPPCSLRPMWRNASPIADSSAYSVPPIGACSCPRFAGALSAGARMAPSPTRGCALRARDRFGGADRYRRTEHYPRCLCSPRACRQGVRAGVRYIRFSLTREE